MSEVKTESQQSRWTRWAAAAPVGSPKWLWQMRILNINIWAAPLIVLGVAAIEFRWPSVAEPSVADRLMFSLPWVGVALGAVALAHALWRIEISVQGDKRPFTEQDGRVYLGAVYFETITATITMGAFIILIFYTLIHGLATGDEAVANAHGRLWVIFSAMYPPMGAMYLLSMFTNTLRRVHTKARTYYEELEKGV